MPIFMTCRLQMECDASRWDANVASLYNTFRPRNRATGTGRSLQDMQENAIVVAEVGDNPLAGSPLAGGSPLAEGSPLAGDSPLAGIARWRGIAR